MLAESWHLSAEAIVRLYAQRMRIEEEFRDTKDIVLGAGLSLSRSRGSSACNRCC